jgi:hypothetical protein
MRLNDERRRPLGRQSTELRPPGCSGSSPARDTSFTLMHEQLRSVAPPGRCTHTEMCRVGSLHTGRIGSRGSRNGAETPFTPFRVEVQFASTVAAMSRTTTVFIASTFHVAAGRAGL